MKLTDALGLVAPRLPHGTRSQRRLQSCYTVADLRGAARRRLPRSVFDYVDGGADQELSLAANPSAFSAYRYSPRLMRDVSNPDTTGTFLGRPAALPLGLAPTGYTRMMHPAGEPAVGRAARAGQIPYVLSTMASTSIEDLARATGDGADSWFQLYVWKDRELTHSMIRRAQNSGYRVLEVAVDTAVSGNRIRDRRNGLTIPPALSLGSLLDIASKPNYWMGMLRGEKLEFANVPSGGSGSGSTIAGISEQFDPSVDWDDLARIREIWEGPMVLKGPLGPQDALHARGLGIDGVHLSNHGGRQLDRTLAPVELIAPVRAAVGEEFGLFVDSGIRHGSDIATAIALGADAAFVGRPYLWALAAGGEAGVGHLIGMLSAEFTRTLQLLGVRSVHELRALGPELLNRQNTAATGPVRRTASNT
ncbi:alpha-hydroxy acid oxidase [Paeniglutamicibacter antarcticus]|uniref:Alpha-hydroxy acid oxidase n=1 Tax=Paeniglutamicibacter antarcticus TaxID=494023 RepID=A0ABP9TP12_9MICC